MKRVLVLLVAAIFLFSGAAFAADQSKAKAAPAKTTSMSMAGKIVDLSDNMLKLDRSVKGKTETVEFALDKPVPAEIKSGDKVKVTYVSKDGKKVATKVAKSTAGKKSTKKK